MPKDEITIYWATANTVKGSESWEMLYQEPESIFAKLTRSNTNKGAMPMCPATRATMKNTFSISSLMDDRLDLNPSELEMMANDDREFQIQSNGKLALIHPRKSSIDGHVNVIYNMAWLMFASEPLKIRITAPYFPPAAPCDNALLSPGEFDIGQWYRAINLDYHIPVSTEKFEIKAGQELFYLEALTDRKIKFQRYQLTNTLTSYALETTSAKFRFGKHRPLESLYALAAKSHYRERILKEIKANLVS